MLLMVVVAAPLLIIEESVQLKELEKLGPKIKGIGRSCLK